MAQHFQALTAQSADMSTVASADGVYRYVSPASRQLFGWDPMELEGHRQEELSILMTSGRIAPRRSRPRRLTGPSWPHFGSAGPTARIAGPRPRPAGSRPTDRNS